LWAGRSIIDQAELETEALGAAARAFNRGNVAMSFLGSASTVRVNMDVRPGPKDPITDGDGTELLLLLSCSVASR